MGQLGWVWFGGSAKVAVLYAKDLEFVTQIWVAQGTSRLLLKEYPKVVNMSSANFQFASATSVVFGSAVGQRQTLPVSATNTSGGRTHTAFITKATTLVTTIISDTSSSVDNSVTTLTSGYIPQGIYIPQLGTEASTSGSSTILNSTGSGQDSLASLIGFDLSSNNYDGSIGGGIDFYRGSFVENSGYPTPVPFPPFSTDPTGLIENQAQTSFAMGTFPSINRTTFQQKGRLLVTDGGVTGLILSQSTESSSSTGNIPMHFRPVGMLNKDQLLTKAWVPYLTPDGSFLIDEFSISNDNRLIATITSAFLISNVADIDAGPRQFLLDRTPQSMPLAPHLVSRGVSYYGTTGAVILTEGVNISAETGFEDVSVGVFNPAEVIPDTYLRTVTVSKPKITAAEATRVLAASAYV